MQKEIILYLKSYNNLKILNKKIPIPSLILVLK